MRHIHVGRESGGCTPLSHTHTKGVLDAGFMLPFAAVRDGGCSGSEGDGMLAGTVLGNITSPNLPHHTTPHPCTHVLSFHLTRGFTCSGFTTPDRRMD